MLMSRVHRGSEEIMSTYDSYLDGSSTAGIIVKSRIMNKSLSLFKLLVLIRKACDTAYPGDVHETAWS